MKFILTLAIGIAISASPALAKKAHKTPPKSNPKSMQDQLMKLDPQARAEQRCNGRAAGDVSREHKGFNPDEVVAYAFAESTLKDAVVTAPGGALRSHGRWYHMSYVCKASPDGLNVEQFSYKLGDEVPRADWAEHYLVP